MCRLALGLLLVLATLTRGSPVSDSDNKLRELLQKLDDDITELSSRLHENNKDIDTVDLTGKGVSSLQSDGSELNKNIDDVDVKGTPVLRGTDGNVPHIEDKEETNKHTDDVDLEAVLRGTDGNVPHIEDKEEGHQSHITNKGSSSEKTLNRKELAGLLRSLLDKYNE